MRRTRWAATRHRMVPRPHNLVPAALRLADLAKQLVQAASTHACLRCLVALPAPVSLPTVARWHAKPLLLRPWQALSRQVLAGMCLLRNPHVRVLCTLPC